MFTGKDELLWDGIDVLLDANTDPPLGVDCDLKILNGLGFEIASFLFGESSPEVLFTLKGFMIKIQIYKMDRKPMKRQLKPVESPKPIQPSKPLQPSSTRPNPNPSEERKLPKLNSKKQDLLPRPLKSLSNPSKAISKSTPSSSLSPDEEILHLKEKIRKNSEVISS
jgi:hypothetical protein